MSTPAAELSIFVVTPLSNINGPPADLSDINGISSRKRKRHGKSRLGCIACKKRRVKCDNAYPSCRHCVRRKETCSLFNSSPQGGDTPPTPQSLSGSYDLHLQQPSSPGFSSGLSTLEMELFHNFIENTAVSLPYGGNIWHDDVVPLTQKHDYLMHAVLLLSAKHLSYLSPNDAAYHRATLFHLGKLLPRYREEVAKPTTLDNADSILATSHLLLYFMWSNVDTFEMNDPACLIKDQLFAMTAGLRETFLSAAFILTTGQSIFSESTSYAPRYSIRRTAKRCSKKPPHFERYFCDRWQQGVGSALIDIGDNSPQDIPQLPDMKHNRGAQMNHIDLWYAITQPQDPLLIGYLDAVVRLAPLCSIASELQASMETPALIEANNTRVLPSDSPVPIAGLARYIFSWPIVSSPGILRLLARKDERMIFLLYQFYKVITVLLPKTYWWAHQRAERMISIFEEKLEPCVLELVQEFDIEEDVVAQAAEFTVLANEKWRQYSLINAMNSAMHHLHQPAPPVAA